MKKTFILAIAILLSSVHMYAQSLKISFDNTFNNELLNFGKTYITPLGDTVSFTTLNYFISNIKLVNQAGVEYALPQDSSYYLLKHSTAGGQAILLKNIPAGIYKELTFTIGVDSVRNTLDVSKRTGALDVGAAARGMYWVWNSGYIFFKLEGKTVSAVDSLNKYFRYHIGGYGGYDKKTINNIKVKTLALQNVVVKKGLDATISIQVAIDKFFNSITPIKVFEHPSVMWGQFSVLIADNYETIFEVKQ
jgi:hypothetical protein